MRLKLLQKYFKWIDISLVFLAILFSVLLFALFKGTSFKIAGTDKEPLQNAHVYGMFQGNVEPFELEDLWVLNNEAKRNLDTLCLFFNARAAGLHYVYSAYEKKYRNKHLDKENVLLGVYMRISDKGVFDSVAVSFTESKNKVLAEDISLYIKKYFRYRRANGTTELILPIRFKSKKMY